MLERYDEKLFLLEIITHYTDEEYNKVINELHHENIEILSENIDVPREIIDVPKECIFKKKISKNDFQSPIIIRKETIYKFKDIDGYFYNKNNATRWGYFCFYNNKNRTCTKIMERGMDGLYYYKGRLYGVECQAYQWNDKFCANVYEIIPYKNNLYVRRILVDKFSGIDYFTFRNGKIYTFDNYYKKLCSYKLTIKH